MREHIPTPNDNNFPSIFKFRAARRDYHQPQPHDLAVHSLQDGSIRIRS